MKIKITLLIAATAMITAPVCAQQPPTTTKEIVIYERDSDGDRSMTTISYKCPKKHGLNNIRFGIDIGINNWVGDWTQTMDGGPDLDMNLNTGKSINVAPHINIRGLRLTRNKLLELVTGVGFDWGNYRFEDDYTIVNSHGNTLIMPIAEGQQRNVDKTKLMTVYATVPLLLQVNIPVPGNRCKRVYVAGGVIGGLKVGSHTKIKYDNGVKDKEHSSFNLNMLRYDLTVRAGYGNAGLFFNRQMTPMFEKGSAPELFPYSIGFSFGW